MALPPGPCKVLQLLGLLYSKVGAQGCPLFTALLKTNSILGFPGGSIAAGAEEKVPQPGPPIGSRAPWTSDSQLMGHDPFGAAYQISCISDIYIVVHSSSKVAVMK